MFQRRVKAVGLEQAGRGFGSLRHIFQTNADSILDETAINILMGHKAEDALRKYDLRAKSGFFDERLLAVKNHVQECLFAKDRQKGVD